MKVRRRTCVLEAAKEFADFVFLYEPGDYDGPIDDGDDDDGRGPPAPAGSVAATRGPELTEEQRAKVRVDVPEPVGDRAMTWLIRRGPTAQPVSEFLTEAAQMAFEWSRRPIGRAPLRQQVRGRALRAQFPGRPVPHRRGLT